MNKYAFTFIASLIISTGAAAMSAVPYITFHGRVIDQNNLPVTGALVYYIGTNNYLSPGAGRGRVSTDDQGYFEINTEGVTLNLTGVTQSSIDHIHFPIPNNLGNTTLSKIPGTMRFLSHDDSQEIYPNWRHFAEKDNPYIIRAWRLKKYEGAINEKITLQATPDGAVYTIRLSEIDIYKRIIKNDSPGELHISCTRPSMRSNRDYGDWQIIVTPVNGGIQETNDLYMNQAPAAGYKSSLNIVMDKNSHDYTHQLLNKRYFFTSNYGQTYGSLFMHFQPYVSYEACDIDISYKINPTGSRNLELIKKNN